MNLTVHDNASLAECIATHYAANLTCFAVGNEPTTYINSFNTYESLTKNYMAGTAPTAKFCGADVEEGSVGMLLRRRL